MGQIVPSPLSEDRYQIIEIRNSLTLILIIYMLSKCLYSHLPYTDHCAFLPEPAKVMFWSICIYLLVCMHVCYQLFSKTTGLNCIKISGMICQHPRTNRLDFGSNQVEVTKRSKTTGPNCLRFSGMICHHPRTNRLDFGSDQVNGQGQGHENVKSVFLSYCAQFSSDSYETNAKMFTFQFPILWYGDKCGVGEGMHSTECLF